MKRVIEIFPSSKRTEADVRKAALQSLGYSNVTIDGPGSFTINDYTNQDKEKSFKYNDVLVLTASK